MDVSKIKLIIWDLDDSFWDGTLSEGPITPKESNVKLVKKLTDQGIVNAVCSKNDKEPAELKLKELGILDYFVFNSIDWTPKGQRIQQMLKDMGLRAANTLFIDDNIINLNEAKYYMDEIMTLNPTTDEGKLELSKLKEFSTIVPAKDTTHTRLNQYKILEQKRNAKNNSSDNIQFLYSTHTQVEIHHDCLNKLDRLAELVLRTNQLNFTKNRMSKEELRILLNDDSVQSGYVTVKDDFGDYGVVGFYAIKNNVAIHFLFSCRTIGQGVEQWVYSTLQYPIVNVIGTTISKLERVEAPKWINQKMEKTSEYSYTKKNDVDGKIVFKGPCDLEMLTSYLSLDSKQVITEFTYFSRESHGSIEHQNHSTNILAFSSLSEQEKKQLVNECFFNDSKTFDSEIFKKDIKCVFLSTFVDPQLAIYQRKNDGFQLAFGDFDCDITDKKNWDDIINKHFLGFTPKIDQLERFADAYQYIGPLTVEESIKNFKEIFNRISPDAYLCLTLGSELKNTKNTTPVLNDRELYHKALNEKIRIWAAEEDRILLIDFNDYVSSDSDYLDSINHFQRQIYYKSAMQLNEYFYEITGQKFEKRNKIFLCYKNIIRPYIIRVANNIPILNSILECIRNKRRK